MGQMTCEQCRRWWSPYMDSELDATKTFEVSEHLRLCDACRKRFENESNMDDLIRESIANVSLPNAFWNKIEKGVKATVNRPQLQQTARFRFSGWLAVAAMVAMLLFGGFLFRYALPGVSVVDADRNDANRDHDVGVLATTVSVVDVLKRASPEFRKFPPPSSVEGQPHDSSQTSARCEQVRRELAEMSRRLYGVEITFEPDERHPHQFDFVAVSQRGGDDGDPYMEVHVNCCGRPTVLVIALANSRVDVRELQAATPKRDITGQTQDGNDVPIQVQSKSMNGVMIAGATARHYLNAIFAGARVTKI